MKILVSLIMTNTNEHWDDPSWVANMKAEVEAELDNDGDADDWAEMTPEQKYNAWEHARLTLGL